MLGPLSPFTYYRRHKRYALLLIGLVALMTLGLHATVGVLDSFLENVSLTTNYLTRFSIVYLRVQQTLYPGAVQTDMHIIEGMQIDKTQIDKAQTDMAQIRVHPDVAHVIPEHDIYIKVPMMAVDESFRLLGVSENDLQVLMDICDMRLKEGRLLEPRTNELVLSEEIARALGLRIGDRIGRSINERYYGSIPTEFVLVGTLENATPGPEPGIRVGFASYEYLNSHELYAGGTSLIVVAHEGRKAAVDNFLETSILSPYIDIETYGRLSRFYSRARSMFYLIFGIVDCLIAAVAALVVGAINRIALAQRLEEFGLLHAIGHSRQRLTRRVTLETAVVAGIGWLIGLALAWLAFAWLKTNFYGPKGLELNLANLTPLWFTVPIPLMPIGFVALSVTRVLARLDSVAVIERGKLSTEREDQHQATKSLTKPLSFWTFYLRHRRRGLTLVIAMALMILGVAFPVFFFSSMQDVRKSLIEHLRYVSVVSARDGGIDPGVVTRIRTQPAVARVIPTNPSWLAISVPPFIETAIMVYGIHEDDMPALIDLHGLELKEGHLPRANEIVISEAVALNRGLHVGDKVGRPVYERDSFLTDMVIAGILRPRSGQNLFSSALWLGFSPYKYQQSELSSQVYHLLVVPAEGRKAEMDSWLEGNVASTHVEVETYDSQSREIQQVSRNMFLLFAVVESVIAIVAAIALAVLNYIFFAQRREEFGVLHAVGHSRARLVLRTGGETVNVVIVAWLIGATVCVAGLVLSQVSIYAPKGLNLNFFSTGPWLFTLPIPLAVVTASVASIAYVLFRLDPVSIIERRQ